MMPKSLINIVNNLNWPEIYQNPEPYYEKYQKIIENNLNQQDNIALGLNTLQKIKLLIRLKQIHNFQIDFQKKVNYQSDLQFNTFNYQKNRQNTQNFITQIRQMIEQLCQQLPKSFQNKYQLPHWGQQLLNTMPYHYDLNQKHQYILFTQLEEASTYFAEQYYNHVFDKQPKNIAKMLDNIEHLMQTPNTPNLKPWLHFIQNYYRAIQKITTLLIQDYEDHIVESPICDFDFIAYLDVFRKHPQYQTSFTTDINIHTSIG